MECFWSRQLTGLNVLEMTYNVVSGTLSNQLCLSSFLTAHSPLEIYCLLPTSLRHLITAATLFCQSSTSGLATMLAEHISPLGFLRGRPVRVELISRWIRRPGCWQRQLQTLHFVTYWCIQHIRGSTPMHYNKFTFTYLLLMSFAWFWSALVHAPMSS